MAQAIDNNKILRVRRNVASMIDQGAPEADLDEYIKSEGVTLEEVRGVGVLRTVNPDIVQGVQEMFAAGNPQSPLAAINPSSEQAGPRRQGFVEGIPDAGRMMGGMLATPSGPLGMTFLAEIFGQALDISTDLILGRPMKGGLERGKEAAVNMFVDRTLMGLGAEGSYIFRRTPMAAKNALRNERAVQVGEDLAEAKVSPKGAALMAGSRTTQGAVELQRGLPFTSDIHQKAINETMDDIRRYADDVARSQGGTAQPAYRAGYGLKEGTQEFADHIDDLAGLKYGEVRTGGKAGRIDEMPVNWTKAQEAAVAARDEIVMAGGKPPEWLTGMIDERPTTISFKEARLRVSRLARIGRNLTEEAAGESQNAAKRLSPKIFEAMEETGKTLDPKAWEALKGVNAWYKESIEQVRAVDEIMYGKTGIDAWRAATESTKKDPTLLLQLKGSLKPSQWTEYVSARIQDMGLETKGQALESELKFSPERFLSAYADLVPDVKNVLFGQSTPLRESVERLARFGSYLREARGMSNPSGTGSKVGTYLMIAGAGASATEAAYGDYWPLAAFAGIVGGNTVVARKLFTNPRFVNWLTDASLVSPANYKGMAAQITRLAGIARSDPESRPYIQQYLEGMSEWMARKAVTAVVSGEAEAESMAAQSRKPLAQRFTDAAAPLSEQRDLLTSLPEPDREQWRKSMRNEHQVMRFFRNAERDIAQIDARLAELGRGKDSRHASSERGRLERQRARLMNEALDFQSAVYGG